MSLLGIDIGSTNLKGVAFSRDGNQIASVVYPYAVNHPAPGIAEVNPDILWQAFISVTQSIGSQTKIDPVESFAISSHGESFIIADEQGNAAAAGIMSPDNRSIQESKELEVLLGTDKIYIISGAPPHAMFPLSKIAWFKKNNPALLKNARYMCITDYILGRLNLPFIIDYSQASRTQLFDINSKSWSELLCQAIGIAPDQLPVVKEAGVSIGCLSSQQADILGLPKKTVVVAGGHDQACGALGLGITAPGSVGDSAGTYECLTISTAQPTLSSKAMSSCLNSYCHVAPEKYITIAFFPSGFMVSFFLEKIYGLKDKNDISQFFEELENEGIEKSSGLIILPHLIGSCNPSWDPLATGVMAGLTMSTTPVKILRGILEGIAAELSLNTGLLEEVAGVFNEIRIFGGGTQSPLGLKLRASATGKKFKILDGSNEASCLGAAILAGVGSGIFSDINQGVKQMVHFKTTIAPDNELASWFSGYKEKYVKLYETLEFLRKD